MISTDVWMCTVQRQRLYQGVRSGVRYSGYRAMRAVLESGCVASSVTRKIARPHCSQLASQLVMQVSEKLQTIKNCS